MKRGWVGGQKPPTLVSLHPCSRPPSPEGRKLNSVAKGRSVSESQYGLCSVTYSSPTQMKVVCIRFNLKKRAAEPDWLRCIRNAMRRAGRGYSLALQLRLLNRAGSIALDHAQVRATGVPHSLLLSSALGWSCMSFGQCLDLWAFVGRRQEQHSNADTVCGPTNQHIPESPLAGIPKHH